MKRAPASSGTGGMARAKEAVYLRSDQAASRMKKHKRAEFGASLACTAVLLVKLLTRLQATEADVLEQIRHAPKSEGLAKVMQSDDSQEDRSIG